ncbi:MAG: metallophosphoesterase [Spirochaetota bacterium]
MKIFATSDVHIDYKQNRKWLFQLSPSQYSKDILILAGDLTDDLSLLEESFAKLASVFYKVLYVPGNHELWVVRDSTTRIDSLQKFDFILQLAKKCGILTEPVHLANVSIVPLFSWYDYSFGSPSPLLLGTWMDFHNCLWPDGFPSPVEVTNFFLQQNRTALQSDNETIISFSHFLPRIDLMPFYIPEKYHYLYPVFGSLQLEAQIRQLQSKVHVYGHSHVNNTMTIDGIKYINNAYGYPSETRIAQKSLECIYHLQDD